MEGDELLQLRSLQLVSTGEDLELQTAQMLVRLDEEVAAATGRIQELQRRQLILNLQQCLAVVVGVLELLPVLVEEQRLDDLLDVLLGGVVLTHLPQLRRIHQLLEHGTEDVRIDLRPVEVPGLHDLLTEVLVELRKLHPFPVQAIDPAEVLELGAGIPALPLLARGDQTTVKLRITEHPEQFGELGMDVPTGGVV